MHIYQYKKLTLDPVLPMHRNRNARRIITEIESFHKRRQFLVIFANITTGVYVHWKCTQSSERKKKCLLNVSWSEQGHFPRDVQKGQLENPIIKQAGDQTESH